MRGTDSSNDVVTVPGHPDPAGVVASPWEPVEDYAPGWRAGEATYGVSRVRAVAVSGSYGVDIQTFSVTTDGRDPVEGERVFRLPKVLRDLGPFPPSVSRIVGGGKVRVEEQRIDDEGWFLVPTLIAEFDLAEDRP